MALETLYKISKAGETEYELEITLDSLKTNFIGPTKIDVIRQALDYLDRTELDLMRIKTELAADWAIEDLNMKARNADD